MSKVLTGRDTAPTERVEEFLGVIGRRGGKTRAMGILAAYVATLCDHSHKLASGERGIVLLIAPDQRQSRVLLGYVEGALRSSPLLANLISSQTQEMLSLANGIDIEVRAASFRRLRGLTCVMILADEASFWMSEETSSVNADAAILAAARPSLATTGGPLVIISSPYAKRGDWTLYRKHFGRDGDTVLVAQAPSRVMNPSLPEKVVERALERDAVAASAEFLAQFRSDISAFIAQEAIDACVTADVFERSRVSGVNYQAFCDPSGGAADSMTLAIGHASRRGDKSIAVLDAVREIPAPFNPDSAVEEFAKLLKDYGINSIRGDRYAAEWVVQSFKRFGISYETSELAKSEIYCNFLPRLNSGEVDLLDNRRLITQLLALERRTARGGRDSIDHPPGGKDDLANAAAGVLV